MSTVLATWTETAPRTPAHQQLRDAAPAGVELHDLWQVYVIGQTGVDGEALAVTRARVARVSTTRPRENTPRAA